MAGEFVLIVAVAVAKLHVKPAEVDKMKKLIEILIVVVVLFMLAFAFGCKDKVEARAKVIYNRALTDTEVAQIYDDPFYEPNEPKLTYTEEELDEIYKDEPALGKLVKSLYGFIEPSEPEDSKIKEEYESTGYLWIPDTNELSKYKWYCSCGRGIREMSTYECRDCGKTYSAFEVILNNIPTWPDYIEIKKDLVIGAWVIEKGTKIYCKDSK